jgi:choline monooxygenase
MNSISPQISELLSKIQAETRNIKPLDYAETLPASWYTDPGFDALDKHFIISRSWQYVGWEAKAQNQGDWFVAEVAGKPIIVVRGNDKNLRAFYNVCRHRGGPLATED